MRGASWSATAGRIHLIPVERLDYAQAQDDYVALHSEGKTYLKTQTLASLEASLDPSLFVRVHRSFIVSLDRIRAVELYAKNSRMATLLDGTRVPVSREGHARLKRAARGGIILKRPVPRRGFPGSNRSGGRGVPTAAPSRGAAARYCRSRGWHGPF